MNTRTTALVPAKLLQPGDVISVKSFSFAYGFRWWQVLETPFSARGRWPENVVLRLRAIHATDEEHKKCRIELYGHGFNVNGDHLVRVWRDKSNLPKQQHIHL